MHLDGSDTVDQLAVVKGHVLVVDEDDVDARDSHQLGYARICDGETCEQ